MIYATIEEEEESYMQNFTFKPRDKLDNATHDFHGFQSAPWSIKKGQRSQLKKDNIKVKITLHYVEEEDDNDASPEPEIVLMAHITDYGVYYE